MKGFECVAQLPDGEYPVGMCYFQGRVLIACRGGKIWEFLEEDNKTENRTLRCVDVDFSGIKKDFDHMVAEGEAQYLNGAILFLPNGYDDQKE